MIVGVNMSADVTPYVVVTRNIFYICIYMFIYVFDLFYNTHFFKILLLHTCINDYLALKWGKLKGGISGPWTGNTLALSRG